MGVGSGRKIGRVGDEAIRVINREKVGRKPIHFVIGRLGDELDTVGKLPELSDHQTIWRHREKIGGDPSHPIGQDLRWIEIIGICCSLRSRSVDGRQRISETRCSANACCRAAKRDEPCLVVDMPGARLVSSFGAFLTGPKRFVKRVTPRGGFQDVAHPRYRHQRAARSRHWTFQPPRPAPLRYARQAPGPG